MSTVGVALVNPTTTAALATFQLKAANGTTLATAQRAIASRGQVAMTLDQLFPAAGEGYLLVDVDNNDVTGFWMAGNFSTSTDGAQLIPATEAAAYPSFGFLLKSSQISLVNIGPTDVAGILHLLDGNGTTVSTAPFVIAAQGSFQRTVASLFPNQSLSFDTTAYSIGISKTGADARILGTAIASNGNADNIVTNARGFSDSSLTFPHVVDGTIGAAAYRTLLTIQNSRSTGKNLTITLYSTSGSRLSVQRAIQPFGTLRLSLVDLFNVASVDGWLSVVPDTDYVKGWTTYTDLVNGGSTAVEGQWRGDTGILFGHIADLSPWWTGIALANATNTNAQVEVYAIDSMGRLIAGPRESNRASFTLAAGSKRAFLLSEIISSTQTRSVDGGYVFVRTTNAVPIFGIELFFLRNGFVYSNVPARRLDGLPFTPPGTPAQRILNVSKGGSGTGTVTSDPSGINCGSTCTATFTAGTQVTLTATPSSGSIFMGWSGACTGTTCTVTMDSDSSVTATFDVVAATPKTLTVTKSGAGSGSVSSTPSGINCGSTCTAIFTAGTQVTLTASPASGSTFLGWFDACTGSTCTLTMDSDKSVVAVFTVAAATTKALSVTRSGSGSGSVSSSPSGINCGSTCTASFPSGAQVTLTATPSSGSIFMGWSGACTGTTCTVTMDSDRSVTATFDVVAATYTISISASPAAGGSVSGGGTFTANTSRTVTATANSGYTFTNWTENGAVVSTSSSYIFTLTSDRTLVANFTVIAATYRIFLSKNPTYAGGVSGDGVFPANTSRTVTATAYSGSFESYAFTNWTESGRVVSTNSSYTFTLTSDRDLVANFTAIGSPVLFSEDFSGGTIDSSRWFVSTEPVSVSSDVGNPPPALKWIWPQPVRTTYNTAAGFGVRTTQTFDASAGGGIEVSFDLVTPYGPGAAGVAPTFTVALVGVNGHSTILRSDARLQIECVPAGNAPSFPFNYADGSVHHYTITISSSGVVTWKRDGTILVDRSVSGCADAANVTVYSLIFSATRLTSSLEMAAWVDNIRVTRP